MKTSSIEATFARDRETVWKVVTDNSQFQWRSDLKNIIMSEDGSSFTEISKEGYETRFTITKKEPYSLYEFDLENENMNGHWKGVFEEAGSGTRIVFTESIKVKKPLMNLVIGAYLKKQQKRYVADLAQALGESEPL